VPPSKKLRVAGHELVMSERPIVVFDVNWSFGNGETQFYKVPARDGARA
jgi:hypothetical protein